MPSLAVCFKEVLQELLQRALTQAKTFWASAVPSALFFCLVGFCLILSTSIFKCRNSKWHLAYHDVSNTADWEGRFGSSA